MRNKVFVKIGLVGSKLGLPKLHPIAQVCWGLIPKWLPFWFGSQFSTGSSPIVGGRVCSPNWKIGPFDVVNHLIRSNTITLKIVIWFFHLCLLVVFNETIIYIEFLSFFLSSPPLFFFYFYFLFIFIKLIKGPFILIIFL